jgi:hypothetical protein
VNKFITIKYSLTITVTIKLGQSLREASSEKVTQKEKVYPKGDSEVNERSVSE